MTRLQTAFNGILCKSTHEIQRTSAFFYYFCDKVTIEPDSIEEQLFSHLRGQNCIYVDAEDSEYAKEVFGQSRQVVGVASSRFLRVLHYPNLPPTKPLIVDTALRMLCVPAAVWKRPLTGGGWDAIHEAFGDNVPRAYMVDVPSRFLGGSNRWIESDHNEKCLVLSKHTEAQLTAQDFYFMIIDHNAIRPLVSQKFWTLLTEAEPTASVDRDEVQDEDDVPLTVLFSPQACRSMRGERRPESLLTPPPPIPFPGSVAALQVPQDATAVPVQTPSTAQKRPLLQCDEGDVGFTVADDLRDIFSTDGRQLQVRVLRTRFDTVRVSVDAGVRFEACVDA
jgi:hypothetical protein